MACFLFQLDETHGGVMKSSAPPIDSSVAPTRVLLVDDDADNRDLYVMYLRAMGLEVNGAADAVQALELLAQEPTPDVLVTDIALPGMDGCDLCRRVKAQASSRVTHVIAMTALPMTDREVSRAREAGSAVLLQKPFLPETLLLEIRAVVALGTCSDADRTRVLTETLCRTELRKQSSAASKG
jgi:CheY-like chemotaxis protein